MVAKTGARPRMPSQATRSAPKAQRGGGVGSRRGKHLLVTGYPGFIAKRLLRRLFAEVPRARITVLVEEDRRVEADSDVAMLGGECTRRVRVVTGDVTKMDAGLAGPEIASLADATHVFHLAGMQRVDASPALLESINVDGTRNMLALAREMEHLERFVHFSSCLVAGDREGVITEDELDEGQGFRTFYEKTKARGEKLARAAMKDLPVTVVRPSIVVGSSETGEIDRFDGVYQIAILVVTSPVGVPLPLPGTGTAPLNLVPVDFVTKAAVRLALDPRAAGRTFHLVDPSPLSARHVYELIAQRAGKKLPRQALGSSLASQIMRLPFMARLSRRQLPQLSLLDRFVVYNCAGTLSLLDGTGISCPRFDTYVDKLTGFVSDALRRQRSAPPSPSSDPLDGEGG